MNYSEKKKKEREAREKASQSAIRNINGQTYEEYKRGAAPSYDADNAIRNIYGETYQEYLKKKQSGQKITKYDTWKADSNALIKEYDDYSYSGKYQTQEAHDDFYERIGKQLEKASSMREKYGDNVEEINAIVDRLSNAVRDNEEGRNYYSQWEDDETYQQFLKYQSESEMMEDFLKNTENADLPQDFEKNSQYVKPTGLKSVFRDQNYEYINDTEWSPKYLGDGNGDVSAQEKKGYDYITEDERRKYNYLYNTQGKDKAKEYLEELNLTERMANDVLEDKRAYAKEHPVLASVESVVKNVAGGGIGFAESAVNKLTGKEIDPNSYANLINRASNEMRESVTEEIDSEAGKFFYQTGMSMADSVAAMAATAWTGPLGLAPGTAAGFILGSNAATSAMLNAKERGVTDGQALATGLAQGAAEMFFEKFSLGNLEALKDVPVTSLKSMIGSVLKQAGIEGSEEVFTSIANSLTDLVINRDLAENELNVQNYVNQGYTLEEASVMGAKDQLRNLFMDFLGGAVSGGVMGGGASALNYAMNRNQTTENLQETETENTETETLNEETEEVVPETEETIQNPEEIPWEEVQMYEGEPQNTEVAPAQFTEESTQETTKESETVEPKKLQSARETVETVLQYGTVDDVVASDIAKNKTIKKAFEEKTGVKITGTEEQQKNTVKEVVRVYAETHGNTTQNTPVATSASQNATVKGKGVEIIGVKSLDGSNPKFEASDGKTYSAEEVSFEENANRKLYADASKLAIVAGDETANSFVKNYKSEYNIAAYSWGFDALYKAGRNGVPLQSALKAADYAVQYTDAYVMTKAWELGARAKKAEDSKVKVEKKQQNRKGKGTFTDETRQGGPVAEIARLVADRTGIDIVRKARLDRDANAAFVPSTMTMLLSENAENEYTSLIHELGEFGLSYNRDDMKQVQEAIIRWWAENNAVRGMEDLDTIIKNYQRVYAKAEGSKTTSQSIDEMINDALGGLFSTDTGTDQFVQWLQKESGYNQTEQRTIIQRVIDIIDNVVKYLKNVIKDSTLSRAARETAQMEEKRANEIRRMFLDALEGAVKTANATGEYTTDAAIKNSLKDFAEQYDAWDGKNARTIFDVTVATDVYKFLGKDNKTIRFDASKIIKIKSKHQEMTDAVIKQIPEVLNNPVLIMKSKKSNTRVVVTGMLQDESGKPVVVVLELEPTGRNGIVVDEIKVASAYGKDGMQNFINKSEILYTNPDKQIISRWTKRTRLQLPVGKASADYNNIVSDAHENATHEMKFSLAGVDVDMKSSDNLISNSESYQELTDNIAKQLKNQKSVEITENSIKKATEKMSKKYKSVADSDSLIKDIGALFRNMASAGTQNTGNFIYLAENIVRPMIEQSKNNLKINDSSKRILNDIKSKRIKLDKIQVDEAAHYAGTYNDFRKKLFGRAFLSKDGTSLDILWKQWAAEYPEWFQEDLSPADQPVRLAEIIDTLKEDYVSEYGLTLDETVTYAAAELMMEYFELPEVKAQFSESIKGDSLQMYLDSLKKEYHDKYVDYTKYFTDVLKKYPEQSRKQLARQQAKFNQRTAEERTKRLERQAKKKFKDRIIKNTKDVVRLLEDNTDKKHVPEVLKNTTLTLLKSMDFLSESGWNTQNTIQLQNRLNAVYRKFSAEENAEDGNAFMQEIDPDFLPTLNKMIEELESSKEIKKIADLSSEQLKEIDYLVHTLKRAISTTNKLIANERYEMISELGDSSMNHMKNMKAKRRYGKAGTKADNMLQKNMLSPKTYFKQMGEGALSIYNELREGLDKRTWKLKAAEDYMKNVIGDTKINKWTGKKANTHQFEYNGKKFDLTDGQLMNLYVLSKRPQALGHLTAGMTSDNGGFIIDAKSTVKGQTVPERKINISEAQLKEMFEELTPEQKKMADQMQRFLSRDCADWGNEVSMIMYGYKKFGEKTYWPIKTDDNYNKTDDKNADKSGGADNSSLYGIRNLGMTKNLVKNAKNPIVVGDIFDVFTEHVANMANYNAFVVPLTDAMKWFNYRSRTDEGGVNGSIKEEMQRAFGAGAKSYFIKFIKDVNGETEKSATSEIANTFISKYKAAAVGANIRTVVQQPTSILRVMSVMNPKYLAAGAAHGSAMKEMKENSAIAIWKSWGYFETGLGQSMKQVLTGGGTTAEKLTELSMWGAGKADDFAWGVIWNAVKEEIKDEYKDIDTSSEEYKKLLSDRFNEVIDETQVVDTVLHRSQIMRGNGIERFATAFMAEPTKSYNLLYEAVMDLYQNNTKENWGKVGRRATVYALTGIATAAAASLADTFRDDDEEKEWTEKYLENLKENAWDNLNPMNMIPYLKEIQSFFKGFDATRMDLEGIDNLVSAVQQIGKYIAGDSSKTLYGVTKNVLRALSQVTGIPMYNLLRDSESLIEQFMFAPFDENKPTNKTIGIRLLKAMKEGNDEQLKKYLSWYEEKYQEKIVDGKTDKDARADLKKAITTQFKEIYQNSSNADKIKIKQLLLKISVGGKQLYKDYDWSSWDEKK